MCLLMYDQNMLLAALMCGRKQCFHNFSSLINLLNIDDKRYPQPVSCFIRQCVSKRFTKTSNLKIPVSDVNEKDKEPEDAVYIVLISSFFDALSYGIHYFTKSILWLTEFKDLHILYLISLIKCVHWFSLKLDKCKDKIPKIDTDDLAFYGEYFLYTCMCVEEQHAECVVRSYISITRSLDNKQAKKEINKNLQAGAVPFTEEKLASSQSPIPTQTSTSTKHLPPNLEAATPGVGATNDPLTVQDQASGLTEATGYTTSTLPDATGSHSQHYGTDFDKDQPLSREERRKDLKVVPKEKDVDTILESHHKNQTESQKKLSTELQATAKPSTKPKTFSNVDRPPRLPRRACIAYKSEQYSLDPKLLSLPKATKYLVKVRTEISPGCFMAKLELHCSR